MQYIVTEEERDRTLEALSHLEEEEGLTVKEASPSKLAVEYLKEYVKALFSQDTWVEARRQEYLESLPRSAANEQEQTTY